MPDDPIQTLASELDMPAGDLAFLRTCDGDDVARLLVVVRDAERRREAALQEAFDRSLRHVPKLLRRQVRRLLVGGGG